MKIYDQWVTLSKTEIPSHLKFGSLQKVVNDIPLTDLSSHSHSRFINTKYWAKNRVGFSYFSRHFLEMFWTHRSMAWKTYHEML